MTNQVADERFLIQFDHEGSNHNEPNFDKLKTYESRKEDAGQYYNVGYFFCFACDTSYKCDVRTKLSKTSFGGGLEKNRTVYDGFFSKGFSDHYHTYEGTDKEHDAKHLEELNKFIVNLKKMYKKKQKKEKQDAANVIVTPAESQTLEKKQKEIDRLKVYLAAADDQVNQYDCAIRHFKKKLCSIKQPMVFTEDTLNNLFDSILAVVQDDDNNDTFDEEIDKINVSDFI